MMQPSRNTIGPRTCESHVSTSVGSWCLAANCVELCGCGSGMTASPNMMCVTPTCFEVKRCILLESESRCRLRTAEGSASMENEHSIVRRQSTAQSKVHPQARGQTHHQLQHQPQHPEDTGRVNEMNKENNQNIVYDTPKDELL